MHRPRLLVALSQLWLLTVPSLAAQMKVLRAEGPVATAPAYRSDSLAMRIETGFGRLDVVAERDPSGLASGKYYVRVRGRPIAIADDPSLVRGAPDLAGFFLGEPTVLLLSTYTGGTGATAVPGYFIKIILLSRDARGATAAQVYSIGGAEDLSTDRFRMVNGPADGRFTLSSYEYTLSYSGGMLRLASGGAATAAPTAPSAAEERVYVAAMKTDLRNLVTAEEGFFADSVKYTTRIGPGGVQFSASAGNTIRNLILSNDGWSAAIGNANTLTTCAIYIGSTRRPPATREGEPMCQAGGGDQ